MILAGFEQNLISPISLLWNVQTKKIPCNSLIYKGFSKLSGGAGGIRTPGGFNSPHAFQASLLLSVSSYKSNS